MEGEGGNNSNSFGGFFDSNEDNLLDTLLIHFSEDNPNAPIAPTPQVGLISEGSVSSVQGQIMSEMSNVDQFSVMQNENLFGLPGTQASHVPAMQSQNSVGPINPMHQRSSAENIQMILNMNPERVVDTQIGGKVNYQPPRRGRPPKKRDLSQLPPQYAKKVSSIRGKAKASTPTPPQVPKASNNAMNKAQNTGLTNPSSGPRQFENGVYDLKYERDGLFLDPSLRFRYAQITPDAEN